MRGFKGLFVYTEILHHGRQKPDLLQIRTVTDVMLSRLRGDRWDRLFHV